MERLKDKNILIVGATGGIGTQLTALLAQSDANLFITGRNEEKLADLAKTNGIPEGSCMALDLENPEEIERLRAVYFKVMPSVDILINASGVGVIRNLEQLTGDDFMRTLNINLVAPFFLMKAFLPAMKESKKGLIINIPGVLGKVPMAGAAAYCASKYGLVGMMQSLREEVKRTEIRITNVYLGGTDSPFWDTIDLRVQREKMVTAEAAAKAIWFLCQQPASGVVSEMVLQPFNHQAI